MPTIRDSSLENGKKMFRVILTAAGSAGNRAVLTAARRP